MLKRKETRRDLSTIQGGGIPSNIINSTSIQNDVDVPIFSFPDDFDRTENVKSDLNTNFCTPRRCHPQQTYDYQHWEGNFLPSEYPCRISEEGGGLLT